jgi:hypothetical protein
MNTMAITDTWADSMVIVTTINMTADKFSLPLSKAPLDLATLFLSIVKAAPLTVWA